MNTTTAIPNTLRLFTIHKIDQDDDSIPSVNITTKDIEKYTNKLFMQNLSAKNKRNYEFRSETTEIAQIVSTLVKNVIQNNLDTIFEAKADSIATRLLHSQKTYAQRYPNVNPPKIGSLVTIFYKHEDKIDLLISKIDQENFISLEDSLYKAGLPDNKATQKSCAISFKLVDDEYQLIDIVVTDTNQKISTFWAEDFLELRPLNDDENNTLSSFNAIDQVLSRSVKRNSLKDYTELRNLLVGYYKTKSSFKYDDMVEYVIGNYQPEEQIVDINKVKESLEKLRTSQKFDTSFEIKPSVIKSRFKRTYKISDKIELRTSDYIEDLKNVIISKENEFGEKVLEIKDISEEVYESFLKKEV